MANWLARQLVLNSSLFLRLLLLDISHLPFSTPISPFFFFATVKTTTMGPTIIWTRTIS